MGSGFGERYDTNPTMVWLVKFKENDHVKTVQVEACYSHHEGGVISFYNTYGNLVAAYGNLVEVRRVR